MCPIIMCSTIIGVKEKTFKMMNEQSKSIVGSRRTPDLIAKIAATITIIGMLVGGASQFFRFDYQVAVFEQLGYPLYLMSIIGLGKIIGAVVLLIPRLPLIFKIGAYTGLVFTTSGAVVSHIIQGMPLDAIPPFIVAGIAFVSCYLHPKLKFVFTKIDSN